MSIKDTQSGVAGKYWAFLIKQYIIGTFPKDERKEFQSTLIEELKNYSFRPAGTDKRESATQICDYSDPKYVARVVMEMAHLMYQNGVARNFLKTIKCELEAK